MSLIALLLSLTIGMGIWTNQWLHSSADHIYGHAKKLETSIETTDWLKARGSLQDLDNSWHKTKNSWMMIVDHHEIDSIETSLARLDSYIMTKDRSLSRSELANLLLLIKHIPGKEEVTLRNIL